MVLIFSFGCPTGLPNFSPIEVCISKLERFLWLCEKKKRKKSKEKYETCSLLYLRNGWYDLLQIWNVASHHKRALIWQIWCSSDKRSRIYECVKIATLLFLLIYSLLFARAPSFLGRTTHYCVSWSTFNYRFESHTHLKPIRLIVHGHVT